MGMVTKLTQLVLPKARRFWLLAGIFILMGFALFFLAEYANMIIVSALAVLMFFGGWLSPFEGFKLFSGAAVPGIIWFVLKVFLFLFSYLWFRATLPRYRYDQIMRLGWKILIPIAIGWIVIIGAMIQFNWIEV